MITQYESRAMLQLNRVKDDGYGDLIGMTGDADDADEEEIVVSSEAPDKLPSESNPVSGPRNHQDSVLHTKVLTKNDSDLTHVVGVDSLHGGYQVPE